MKKFWKKNIVLMNIHEYANELICIYWYNNKGCSMIFNLIPILQISCRLVPFRMDRLIYKNKREFLSVAVKAAS